MLALTTALALLSCAVLAPSGRAAVGSGVISGTAFEDTNRDGIQNVGEPAKVNQGVYLLSASGSMQLGYTTTDAFGRYRFSGLEDGGYRVEYAPEDWWAIRNDWVPTTTGSPIPRVALNLAGAATVDFGWRRIVRSADVATPITSYTGPNGLTVNSYDDVVAARALYDDLVGGSLVGSEAGYATIRFDLGNTPNVTDSTVTGAPGSFSNYHADISLAYISWLDSGDQLLFHEYGHAWSLYYAYMRQQDTSLTSYLQARGILGDPRLDTSHAWSRRELIAEDYRQLFGTADARSFVQENVDLPPAQDVPGLRDFLATTFMQQGAAPPPPPTPPPPPPPSPEPAPLTVSSMAMNPDPVKASGTAFFSLSAGAVVTLVVRDAKGGIVRTLLSAEPKPAGQVSAVWDRRTATGARAKAGTYSAVVTAVGAGGSTATATRAFGVS
jgi:hypothetical protein